MNIALEGRIADSILCVYYVRLGNTGLLATMVIAITAQRANIILARAIQAVLHAPRARTKTCGERPAAKTVQRENFRPPPVLHIRLLAVPARREHMPTRRRPSARPAQPERGKTVRKGEVVKRVMLEHTAPPRAPYRVRVALLAGLESLLVQLEPASARGV